jgi:hypothetical protein
VYGNKFLRRIFGFKRGEATENWRKLLNDEVHYFIFSPESGKLSQYSDGLWAGSPSIRGSIPNRGKGFFSSPKRRDRLWGIPSLLYSAYRGPFFSPGVK